MIKKTVLITGLLLLGGLPVPAGAIAAYPAAPLAAAAGELSPKNKLFSYTTISKLEALFLHMLELYGNIDSAGEVFVDVDYQFKISGSTATDYGIRSYDVDIAIDSATFTNFSAAVDSEFALREETESESVFSKQVRICADRIVIRGEVLVHQYAFARNDVALPENDNQTGFFDHYSFYASGHSDAELVLQGDTCLPLDITIRIDRQTATETFAHEISPAYRQDELVEGVPKTALTEPVITEAGFEGISIPVFLIPEEYAATVIAAALDEWLNGAILHALAEEVFVLDVPPALDALLQKHN
ncbi:hypothetical protein ACFL43_03165 [Thermodesulfobacteriota bacterium]